jgi:hypothetical protein
MTAEIKKRGRGRPRKSEVAAVKPGNKGQVGRPKGDAAIINEYKQAAAWKLVMDRILPVGAFEKDVVKDAGRNAIQINISGVGATEITTPDIIEGEVVDES